MTKLSETFEKIDGSEEQGNDGRASYYGYTFKGSDLDKIVRHPLFRPSQHEIREDADFAIEGSREIATAAIVRATRYACGPYSTQGQVDEATQVVLTYLNSLPEEDFEVDGDEPGFFNPDDVANELHDVVMSHFGNEDKDNTPAPSGP